MVMIVGHRGARNLWPENSLGGFRRLLALDVESVEFDVHETRDRQFVVIHDPTLDRTTFGTGAIRDLDAAAVVASRLRPAPAAPPGTAGEFADECVPTLDAVLELLRTTPLELHIEIKTDALGEVYENLVSAGNARSEQAGLDNLRFQQGEASNLADLEDESFGLVVSVFGAMFAPRPDDVAREMVRVTRPGGRIIMGNWIPGDPTLVAQILRISAAYTPAPPSGFVSPMTWGDEEIVRQRFTAAGIADEDIHFQKSSWFFRDEGSPEHLFETFRDYYGPTMNAFAAAAKDGREEQLDKELRTLFIAQNKGSGTTAIPATFLKVTVDKK